jgi:cob(I)alamin adenosyltransferase
MTIYTKVGDGGSTRMPDGQLSRKDQPLVEAIGHMDELNSSIGFCVAACEAARHREIAAALAPLQGELFVLGALLADPRRAGKLQWDPQAVQRMERQIDQATAKLPPLEHFVLPGGSELACRLHLGRTVCRRAERRLVAAMDGGAPMPPQVVPYINRLSDLLFTLARLANQTDGQEEVQWHG